MKMPSVINDGTAYHFRRNWCLFSDLSSLKRGSDPIRRLPLRSSAFLAGDRLGLDESLLLTLLFSIWSTKRKNWVLYFANARIDRKFMARIPEL